MVNFQESIRSFNSQQFGPSLRRQITSLPSGSLPLEKGLTQGGYIDDSDIEVTILSSSETELELIVKLGVFFTEIVINCGCGDDPMPINAYCEMQMIIDRQSAAAEFSVI